jgi:CheY-like chemotaxis protein
MTQPVLVAVDDDGGVLAALEQALRKRYGADYQVLAERSPAEGLRTLERLRRQDVAVAVIIADQWMPQMTGLDLLARARELHPAARRLLLIGVWDRSANQLMSEAMTLGWLDGWVLKPWEPAEEHLYLPVSEQLTAWIRATGQPGFVAIEIVGSNGRPVATKSGTCWTAMPSPTSSTLMTARPAGGCCARPVRTAAACRCWSYSTGGCWLTRPTPRAPPPSAWRLGPSQATTTCSWSAPARPGCRRPPMAPPRGYAR